jgi:hypothetical protein
MPRQVVTWRCCNGPGRTAVSGPQPPAPPPPRGAIWRCSSGPAPTAVLPPSGPAQRLRGADTSSCCAGQLRTGAKWTLLHPWLRLNAGAWRCCSGCMSRAVSGTARCALGRRRGGHLLVLQWARANGCPWEGSDTCAAAAGGGHLEVLQWARANGCNWDENTCASAARGGHLKVLQWAHSNGCPWNTNVCAYASEGGHLEVLQWARTNGCEWNSDTCRFAVRSRQADTFRWARANGCYWDLQACLSDAAVSANAAVWIQENE